MTLGALARSLVAFGLAALPAAAAPSLEDAGDADAFVSGFLEAELAEHRVPGAVFVLVRGGSFTSRREVLKVGDVSVTAEEKRPIEAWIAGLAVVGGVVLVVAEARRKA